jgi:hypothetical protein
MEYASSYVLKGNESSRRDDLISLGYMLIFLYKKNLPWKLPLKEINRTKYLELINKKETNIVCVNSFFVCFAISIFLLLHKKYPAINIKITFAILPKDKPKSTIYNLSKKLNVLKNLLALSNLSLLN